MSTVQATQSPPVQAVVRGLRVLKALAVVSGSGESDMGVTELSRTTGLSPATVHRLLATLTSEGYAWRDDGGRYRLGSAAFTLFAAAESGVTSLRQRVASTMEAIAQAYGETVSLSVLDRRHIVYVDQLESAHRVRAFYRVGNRVLAHASAAGKALLAHEPSVVLERLADAGPLEQLTPATITAGAELLAHLEVVRQRGYAMDLGEQDEDVVCIGAPILQSGRRPAGALSISGPASRMRRMDLDEVGGQIAKLAAQVPPTLPEGPMSA